MYTAKDQVEIVERIRTQKAEFYTIKGQYEDIS